MAGNQQLASKTSYTTHHLVKTAQIFPIKEMNQLEKASIRAFIHHKM